MSDSNGISRERLEQALAHSTFAQLLGAELLDFAPGRVSLQVRSRPDLCQHHGYMHGAVVGFMVDTILRLAYAVVDSPFPVFRMHSLCPVFH